MVLKFELGKSAVTDPQLGIDIYGPRVEHGRSASESDYQYEVVILGRSDGIALWANTHVEGSATLSESYVQVSLNREDDVQWILNVKRTVGSTDDDFPFLVAFSEGLLMTRVPHSDLYTTFHYTLLADEAVLVRAGVTVPAGAKRDGTGRLMLAQLVVPRRGGES